MPDTTRATASAAPETPTPTTLFSRRSLWQSWLDVEVALAASQAELGLLPAEAAAVIADWAQVDRLGLAALEAEATRTEAPIVALVHVLAARAGDAGAWVHWGATTQNVMQTGRLLLLRIGHRQVLGHLAGAVERLGALAGAHASTLMAARTNRRHALPISFGFKLAGWIEELERATERLGEAERRVFALPFGGAVGAMHAFEGHGRDINRLMARRLGLRELRVPGRTVNDLFVEHVVQCAMLAMTIERIAGELYRLMSEEIAEVAERASPGVIGSSTMPHKVNPKRVVRVVAMASRLRALAAPAMQAGLPSHEGDAVANHLIADIQTEACPLAWRLAQAFEDLVLRVEPRPARMAENLRETGALMASEHLMMRLASRLGRTAAHDLVHAVLAQARDDEADAVARLVAEPAIRAHLSADEIRAALDPGRYLGDSAAIAREAATLASTLAGRLRAAADGQISSRS